MWTRLDYDDAYKRAARPLYTLERGRYRFGKQMRALLVRDLAPEVFRSDTTLLDVGCGTGLYFHRLVPSGTLFGRRRAVVGLDFSREALSLAAENARENHLAVDLVQADICNLPFATGTVENVMAMEILEHVWEHNRAVCELFRILRPGGLLVASVPNTVQFPLSPTWWQSRLYGYIAVDGQVGHVRRYTLEALQTLVTSAGFVVQRAGSYIHFTGAYLQRLNDRYLLRTGLARTACYRAVLFPLALALARIESRLLYSCKASYGLMIKARKPG